MASGVAQSETTKRMEVVLGVGNKGILKGIAPKDKKEDKVMGVKIPEIEDRDSPQSTKSSIVLFIRMKEEDIVILIS